MFYLLEDNSIVDSENLPKNVKIERIAKDDKNNAFFIQIQYLDFLNTRKIGYIKKQSENVYDLIEVGDLVKTLGIFRVDVINTPLKQIYSFLDRKSTMVIKPLGVNAIYKPDENGNYIKVWEKLEDE